MRVQRQKEVKENIERRIVEHDEKKRMADGLKKKVREK